MQQLWMENSKALGSNCSGSLLHGILIIGIGFFMLPCLVLSYWAVSFEELSALVGYTMVPSFGAPLRGSQLMILMPERTAAGLGVESGNIDEGCQRTRRERQGRLREVT